MIQAEQNQQLDKHLKQVYGSDATFRSGQKEAIQAVLSGKRTLVVQKTGWGKSLIYFLATRILRNQGRGFSIIISPLLALINNQIDSARRIGLKAYSINSNQNPEEWPAIYNKLLNNEADILFISPERLANEDFVDNVIHKLNMSIGMFVVDESHCISDWGHDFRPDYQRIVDTIQYLPGNVPLLATTATANDRVINDILNQMGQNVHLLRGSLARESLYIQIIHLKSKEERLAWLVENINKLDGTGIIYCLTRSDCEMVSNWLVQQNINAYFYTGAIEPEERLDLEHRFINNQMKVLVATVAFGMGVDKPDISFVIHFQKPGNVVSYYQQIGRAGRNIPHAYAVLLAGSEDDEINDYFIKSAFPTFVEMDEIIKIINSNYGFGKWQLLQQLNMSLGRLEKALKYLTIKNDIYIENRKYYKYPKIWQPNFEHSRQITEMRYNELRQMNVFVETKSCYMNFVTNELNDTSPHACGHCANCAPKSKLPELVSSQSIFLAQNYLKSQYYVIKPRKKWPTTVKVNNKNKIQPEETYQEGRALSCYGDSGWGKLVSQGKYREGFFSQELVIASSELLRPLCREWEINWITAIPSLRHPNLVADFAIKLAQQLNLPYLNSLAKSNSVEQKSLENSQKQFQNAYDTFEVIQYYPGNVLLVDDMVDSRWTLTVCANKLILAGVSSVYPFALANTAGNGARGGE